MKVGGVHLFDLFSTICICTLAVKLISHPVGILQPHSKPPFNPLLHIHDLRMTRIIIRLESMVSSLLRDQFGLHTQFLEARDETLGR